MEARWMRGNLVVAVGKMESGQTVLEWLQSSLALPENYARKLLHEKRVRLSDTVLGGTDDIPPRGRIVIQGQTEANFGAYIDIDSGSRDWLTSNHPSILFEDEHLMVLDKPAGWLIHSDGNETHPVLTDWANYGLAAKGEVAHAYHVHRLDRDTTGCVLYAKHEFMARALDSMMSARLVHRTYVAVLHGRMKEKKGKGKIELPIGRDRHVAGKYRVSATGKPATTLYRELAYANDVSVVECVLLTGRTHQIRVHFAACGCPLVGDTLYGLDGAREGQALHARRLDFIHPYTREALSVLAPYSSQFERELERYGINPEVIA